MCACMMWTSCFLDKNWSTDCLCNSMPAVICSIADTPRERLAWKRFCMSVSSGKDSRACWHTHILIIIIKLHHVIMHKDRKRWLFSYLNKRQLRGAMRSEPEILEDVPWLPSRHLTGQSTARRVLIKISDMRGVMAMTEDSPVEIRNLAQFSYINSV